MKIVKRWIFLAFLFFVSCGIKQPIDQTVTQAFGAIVVSSSPPGGVILLDRQPTYKNTPDTLYNIPSGSHIVHVLLPEYSSSPDSHLVIVEQEKVHHVNFVLEKIIQFGRAVVTSQPAGAEIYVDGQPTGQITPDTLILEPGSYLIEAQKNGFISQQWNTTIKTDSSRHIIAKLGIQQRVLLEGFANVSCTPCVEASHNLDLFRENTPDDQFVVIEYYANWPSPNDPFNKVAPQDVMQRVMYYGLTTLPSLFVGGPLGADAGQYANIENAFKIAQSTQTAQTAISLNRQLVDGQLSVKAEVYQFDAENIMGEQRLYVAIIENDIHFNSPPGSNGLVDFNVVFRGFLSDRDGDFLDTIEHQTLTYDIMWPAFNFENSQLVAFVQNTLTKQIIQTTIN
jgi:hypothetical protein